MERVRRKCSSQCAAGAPRIPVLLQYVLRQSDRRVLRSVPEARGGVLVCATASCVLYLSANVFRWLLVGRQVRDEPRMFSWDMTSVYGDAGPFP